MKHKILKKCKTTNELSSTLAQHEDIWPTVQQTTQIKLSDIPCVSSGTYSLMSRK